MYRFNLLAIEQGADQVWSADSIMDNSGTTGTYDAVALIDNSNFSNIKFSSADSVFGNRNIVSGTSSSLLLSETSAEVVAIESYKTFTMSMAFHSGPTDLWLIKFNHDDYELGVKLNQDNSLTLHWVFEEQAISTNLIYVAQTTYFYLSYQQDKITLQVNDVSISLDSDKFDLKNFSLGGGEGGEPCLIDKIAVSRAKTTPSLNDYGSIINQQRLDTIYRPGSRSTFTYLIDSALPDRVIARREDFQTIEGVKYFTFLNNRTEPRAITSLDTFPVPIGRFEIIKRASFDIDYSVDQGENWFTIGTRTLINEAHESIIFRHESDSDEDYLVDIRVTFASDVPMSYYDIQFDGPFYMPPEVGTGYYDAVPGNFGMSTITLTDIDHPEELLKNNFDNDNVNWYPGAEIDYSVHMGGSGSLSIKPEQTLVYGPGEPEVIPVNEGDNLALTLWAKRSANLNGTTHNLVFKDVATDSVVWTVTLGTSADQEWHRVASTYTVPAGVERLKAEMFSDHLEGYLWIDSMSIRKVGTPTIKTLELLCSRSDFVGTVLETDDGLILDASDTTATGYTMYTNVGNYPLASQKMGQLVHIVIVFDTAKRWVSINPRKTIDLELVGIGASNVAYTQADITDVFADYVGITLLSATSTGLILSGAPSPNGDGLEAAVLDLQWTG